MVNEDGCSAVSFSGFLGLQRHQFTTSLVFIVYRIFRFRLAHGVNSWLRDEKLGKTEDVNRVDHETRGSGFWVRALLALASRSDLLFFLPQFCVASPSSTGS